MNVVACGNTHVRVCARVCVWMLCCCWIWIEFERWLSLSCGFLWRDAFELYRGSCGFLFKNLRMKIVTFFSAFRVSSPLLACRTQIVCKAQRSLSKCSCNELSVCLVCNRNSLAVSQMSFGRFQFVRSWNKLHFYLNRVERRLFISTEPLFVFELTRLCGPCKWPPFDVTTATKTPNQSTSSSCTRRRTQWNKTTSIYRIEMLIE